MSSKDFSFKTEYASYRSDLKPVLLKHSTDFYARKFISTNEQYALFVNNRLKTTSYYFNLKQQFLL